MADRDWLLLMESPCSCAWRVVAQAAVGSGEKPPQAGATQTGRRQGDAAGEFSGHIPAEPLVNYGGGLLGLQPQERPVQFE